MQRQALYGRIRSRLSSKPRADGRALSHESNQAQCGSAVQGVGALLVGLQPEMCRGEAVSLVGVDAETGATWPIPPTLFLSVELDHPIILQYMKNCVEYFLERVRHPAPCPILLPLSIDPFCSGW